MAMGEAPLRAAIRWIDEQMRDHPQGDRLTLIDEAGRRFDLTPMDQDFLLRHFSERKTP